MRPQENRALVVDDAARAAVGIGFGRGQRWSRVVGAARSLFLQRLRHVVEAQRRFLRCARGTVDRLHDPVFEIGGEALVEPAVGPGGVGDEVARPAMRKLVRDKADQALVAGDEGRRQEGEGRIFHPAVGEGGRQDDDVVAAPAIGPVKLLRCLDHFLGVGQLGRGAVEHDRLGPDAGARPKLAEGEVAGGNGDQIGRDRLVHPEAIGAAALAGRLAVGRQPFARHDHFQRLGCGDLRAPGLADAGAVLGRDPGPVERRLALAQQIGVLLAGGLLGRQPLQRGGVGRRTVADDDPLLAVARQVDGQRRALLGIARRRASISAACPRRR